MDVEAVGNVIRIQFRLPGQYTYLDFVQMDKVEIIASRFQELHCIDRVLYVCNTCS